MIVSKVLRAQAEETENSEHKKSSQYSVHFYTIFVHEISKYGTDMVRVFLSG